jgi:hypothetical protein
LLTWRWNQLTALHFNTQAWVQECFRHFSYTRHESHPTVLSEY